MYKTMMGNPEMYEMMMNMINGESSKMKHDMMKNSLMNQSINLIINNNTLYVQMILRTY